MMVHLTIDGQPVEVEEGTTILQAAKKACIHIPTLCYHEDLSIKAVCRICVVEVEGQRLLPTACSTPVSEGMVVQTASPKVLKARRNILELIFARHPQECLVCPKDGKCDLQKVAQDVGMHLDIRYDKQLRHQKETGVPRPSCGIRRNVFCAGVVWRSAMRFRESTSFRRKTVDSIR